MLALPGILFGGLFPVAVAWAIGRTLFRNLPVPAAAALAAGMAIESLAVFCLLLAGAAHWAVFAALGGLCLGLGWRAWDFHPARPEFGHAAPVIIALYGLLYFIHSLAPEISPDGITYHLGLVAEYVRLGKFPMRAGFYEVLPQGLEMIYVVAFAFGKHSAAKLVHYATLIATLPLIVALAKRFGFPERTGWAAAALYFCTPVVGVTAASSYNDAALVFMILAAGCLLVAARETGSWRCWAGVGLAAGFCYAIKMTGGLIPAAAVALARRRRPAAWVALAATAMIAPWVVRSVVLTRNPLALLLNRWFPNPHFSVHVEETLAQTLTSYGGISRWEAPLELVAGERLQGTLGPLLLLIPGGLLALRRRPGRWCWAAALLLAIPWALNAGARFLMPALPFLWLALASVLPAFALSPVVALHALLSWPEVLALYQEPNAWRLRELPVRAAFRLEPEETYLPRKIGEYKLARLLEDATKPDETTLALWAVPRAYTTRRVDEYWHTAAAVEAAEMLVRAYRAEPLQRLRAEWPAESVTGLRLRAYASQSAEWDVAEVRVFHGEDPIHSSPNWTASAKPNRWKARLAFDGIAASRWTSDGDLLAGSHLEIVMDRSIRASAIELDCTGRAPVEVDARGIDGRWRAVTDRFVIQPPVTPELRRGAIAGVRNAGFHYILAPTGREGLGELGADLEIRAAEWGIVLAGEAGPYRLFRIQ